jgi:uncharacterized membrane protein
VGITAIVVDLLLGHFGAPVSRFCRESFGLEIPEKFWMTTKVNPFSKILVVIVIPALGYFSRYFLGRAIIHLAEKIIDGVPFVNAAYKTVKEVVKAFNKNCEALFETLKFRGKETRRKGSASAKGEKARDCAAKSRKKQ